MIWFQKNPTTIIFWLVLGNSPFTTDTCGALQCLYYDYVAVACRWALCQTITMSTGILVFVYIWPTNTGRLLALSSTFCEVVVYRVGLLGLRSEA